MKPFAVSLAGLAITVAALSYSKPARALGPVDIEIGARGGYATKPSGDSAAGNPYAAGFGGRAGVSVFGFYGGVSGIYYFGSGSTAGVTPHSGLYGFEVGYTLPVPFVKIRPEVGIGDATLSAGQLASKSYLYLEPGVLVMVPLGLFFVGADVNALILPSVEGAAIGGASTSSKAYVSLSLHAQVGVHF